ncbi:cytochrome-c peroxidase [Maribacter algarum]|uniref:Cytochrome-c peroxidase n=1 Tax=Maribacter algarum (ex Zhang et al. 2020) TaxID=2578118 RepID=A0A5S3PSS6_9FLAO|nr:cytochrome c peroxidase [Maribacter algarum]TMM58041.1 cytochrome-c peroxidase [Maribacter algarum]
MKSRCIFIISAVALLISGCREEKYVKVAVNAPKVSTTITALPENVKFPDDNPFSERKVELGRLLFFDPILSGNKDVACATCHHPSSGYAEFRDLSIGPNARGFGSKRKFNAQNDIPFVKRNSQTVINTAFNGIDTRDRYDPETATMFWDERAKSLEKQALEPIKAFEEMRGHGFEETEILEEVVKRLREITEYQELFAAAFGGKNAISVENLGNAIATFERTLVTNNSRFDQFMRGDEDAILLSEKDGFELFKSVGCVNCHNGPMFSDYKIHILGVPDNNKLVEIDKGVRDSFAFRTPSLRNLRFTAPYMHNGSLKNLRQVLEFYEDIAGGKERNPSVSKSQYDPFVRELKLSVKEMSLIISFLNTLNDDSFDKTIPENVPSRLQVGGNIQ